MIDHCPPATIDRNWIALAVQRLEADARRSADTHLVKLPLSGPVDLYLKDESTHPTGSLKHRLARSLFLYALCNGWIGPTTTVVEASSGSTAVSEAYFARLIGVPFVAVMARTTTPAKIALIEGEGGRCHLIDDPAAVSDVAARLARELDGHFLDQFTYAERATDWRGNNNIAESTLAQMALEPHSTPSWIVVGAGTGGTAATFGRYLRLRGTSARLCVVDPEGSAFLPSYRGLVAEAAASRIEGIGRPRVEPSFVRGSRGRLDRHAHVRQRRPVHRYLRRRHLARRAGNRHRPLSARDRTGLGRAGLGLPVGGSAESGRQLLDHQAHREVDPQPADLVAAQVIDDRVRHPDVPAGGLDPGKLAGMGTDEIRLDRRLAFVHEQVFQLGVSIKGDLVHIPDQLPGTISPHSRLIGPLD